MKVFWDTSAVLALVLKDKHGRAAAGIAAQADMQHIATPFVPVEAENRLHAMQLEKLVHQRLAPDHLSLWSVYLPPG
jgi:hypothetical protein